jgi:hypothetical protein
MLLNKRIMPGVAVDTTIYCNQLGMLIEFSYCTAVNDGLPCRNIIGCWKERMDILAFLRETFTDDQLKKVFSGVPKSRIERIIDSLNKDD